MNFLEYLKEENKENLIMRCFRNIEDSTNIVALNKTVTTVDAENRKLLVTLEEGI